MKNRSTILVAGLSVLACFTLLPRAQAVNPSPDGCYPNLTTAEGCNALKSLTTGVANTGLGWYALFTDTIGNYNTAVGAGALALNTADSNTAVGAAALLLNVGGTQNTGVGAGSLVSNDTGSFNTAAGYFALTNNTIGGANTAIGWEALTANTEGINNVALGALALSSNINGSNNTAIGNLALQNATGTNESVCVGRLAGSQITTANNNIIIGHHNGMHSRFGQEDNVCYIGNIWNRNVDGATAQVVLVDPDGRLGTMPVPVAGISGDSSPEGVDPQAVPDARNQAMLNVKVQNLRATVARQQQQIQMLTTQLKENAAQIEKANAKLEMNMPVAKMAANKR